MNFNLKEFEEFLHVQYKVILLRNNTVALLCTFANTSRFICTLVTLGKGKGIEMVSVQDFSGVCKRFSFPSCFFQFSSAKEFAFQNVAVITFHQSKAVKLLCFI